MKLMHKTSPKNLTKKPHPVTSDHPLLNKERVGTQFRGEVFW